MKSAILLVVLCLFASTLAEETKFKTKLTSLLNMQAKAVDAVESALNLLRDLRNANVEAQARADEVNRTQEYELGLQIADLKYIADLNKETGNQATDHRKHIESEIAKTQEYLAWINQRRADIDRKREALREGRCYSNFLFIKALKEHDEALDVIAFLRDDVTAIVEGQGSVNLAEIKDSASKLQAYAHIFSNEAMKEFAQLQQVDDSALEWNDDATDNERSALGLEHLPAGTESRNVGQRFLDLINGLEDHLRNSIADLEKNEVQAAWDLAVWLQDSFAEQEHLDTEEASNKTYIDKLLISIIAAKAHEDKAWEIYFESAAAYNDGVEDLQGKRDFWADEKARRDEENAILDEIIQMFIDRVSILDSNMKGKVNDPTVAIFRNTDGHVQRDAGRLAANVDAESRAL